MNDIRSYRVYFNPPRRFRIFGCMGCLLMLFILGGVFGLLWSGWKSLLGLS